MFIKYLDYLSPRVTFYHKGFLSHSSIISGILSIITIIFVIALGVYFSLDIIKKKNPRAFYLHGFLEDAGIYQVNTTSFFHFISLAQIFKGETINEEIDFTIFSIVGSQLYGNNYLNTIKYNGIESFDHWLYGYWNKEINVNGLDDLINYKFFNKSACIKKYYNSTEHKYYDIGHPKFSWPIVAHGTFNEKSELYGIYTQKCNNQIIKQVLGKDYQCKNDSEINKFFDIKGTKFLHLYFINNYVDISNYEKPYFEYFYRIETQLSFKQYTTNNINFSPSLVKTDDGLIFDNIKEKVSYIFDRNDAYILDIGEKDIYLISCFLLKNIREVYERSYKRIQDIISSIGGIYQAITIIAIYINSLYNHFIVLSDTELLLHSLIYNEKENNEIKTNDKNKTIKHKIKDIEKGDIEKGNNEYKKSSEDNKRNNQNSNSKIKINKNDNDISKSNNLINNVEHINNKKKISVNNVKNIDNEIIDKKENSKFGKKIKSFWDFLYYKMTCGKKVISFKIYNDFRIKIISEEHIIRNHLNIYNLLKITRKRKNKRSSYQLKDLINLI